jgi:hypothetical protein
MKITRKQLRQIIKEAISDDQDFFRYETDAVYAELVDLLDDIASPGWIKWNLEDGLTKDEIIAKAQRGEERSREWMAVSDHSDDIGSQDMADAKRAVGDDPQSQADHLGISVEDWYTIRQELDDHYEDRHMEDQMEWEDDDPDIDNDGMLSVGELVKMTQSIADDVQEAKMKITPSQLRNIINEEISNMRESKGGGAYSGYFGMEMPYGDEDDETLEEYDVQQMTDLQLQLQKDVASEKDGGSLERQSVRQDQKAISNLANKGTTT